MLCVKSANNMGWFTSDNFITNEVQIAPTELKIMVGVSVTAIVIVIAYLIFHVVSKYNKRGVQAAIQHEIRLNNVRVQNIQWLINKRRYRIKV